MSSTSHRLPIAIPRSGYRFVHGGLKMLLLLSVASGMVFADSWESRRLRIQEQIDKLELIAVQLLDDWPREDGDSQAIGPFMAYPASSPQTLILLTPDRMLPGGVPISAIDRSRDGTLRFQIGGIDEDEWIEWHQGSHVPDWFVGGLGDFHQLKRRERIAGNWYRVRYRPIVQSGTTASLLAWTPPASHTWAHGGPKGAH